MTTNKHGGPRPPQSTDDGRLRANRPEPYTPFSIKWPPAMLRQVKRLAAKQSRPVAHLVFEAVRDYLAGADAPEG